MKVYSDFSFGFRIFGLSVCVTPVYDIDELLNNGHKCGWQVDIVIPFVAISLIIDKDGANEC